MADETIPPETSDPDDLSAVGAFEHGTYVGYAFWPDDDHPQYGVLLTLNVDTGERWSYLGDPKLVTQLRRADPDCKGRPLPRHLRRRFTQAGWKPRPGWPDEWEASDE